MTSKEHVMNKWMSQSKRPRIILSVLLVIVAGSLVARALKAIPKTVPEQPVLSSTPCDYVAIHRLIEKMKTADIIYKIEKSAGSSEVSVKEVWYALPLDGKEMLDIAVQCDATGIIGKRVRLRYVDYRTGKRVATSDEGGLSID